MISTPQAAVGAGEPRRGRRPPRRRRHSGHWAGALQTILLTLIDQHPNSAVLCLVMPRRRLHRAANFGKRAQLPAPSFLGGSASIHKRGHAASPTVAGFTSIHWPRHQRGHAASSTTTALPLFDKFLHPYGISNETNYHPDDDFDESSIELLNALLPRLQTEEERARLREEFHRARLDHQLRLSKRANGNGGKGTSAKFLADDAEEVARMTELFQQARLREQLRLSKQNDGGQRGIMQSSGELSRFDKDEAFHRALLAEGLRIRRLHQQRQHFLSSPKPIEMAMKDYENETNELEEEHRGLRTLTMEMAEEKADADDNAHDVGEEIARAEDNAVVILGSLNEIDDDHGNVAPVVGDVTAVNQTEDVPGKMLSVKLERLHEMVTITTSSPADAPPATAASKPKFSLQKFLSSTNLPLPPREDASVLSLVLAPIAHLLTAAFLLGAAGIYAVTAVVDVLWNDTKDEYSTRKCLKEASSVMPQCIDYVFPADSVNVQRSAFQRTLRALQTSCIASYYAIECIVVRAAKHSRFANECMEAGTGSLRYMVYAARSLNAIWIRAVDALVGSPKDKDQTNSSLSWTRRLNPIGAVSRRFNKERSLKEEQQRLRADELYNKKLRQLNLDRVDLERERKVLEEQQRQLDFERRKLLGESVNVVAWYSAAREAAVAAENGEMDEANEPKKRRWSLWGGKERSDELDAE